MTAHAMAGAEERGIAAGLDGYLSKPMRPDALSNVLQTYSSVAADAAKLEKLPQRIG